MPQRATIAACLLLAVLTAGCAPMSTAPDAGEAAAATPPLDGTAWVLAALPGLALVGGHPATVRFEGGHAQGSDGCNRYSNAYTSQGATLNVAAQGVATQMACAPEVMQQAAAYRAALGSARSFRVSDGQLQLLAGDGAVVASFAPQSQALPGTAWRAIGINNGKGAVASVLHGSTVSLEFGADGRASGSAGCNQYTTRYEASGSAVRFTTPATTRRFCAGEGLMAQEQAFVAALESVATARFEADRLELRTTDGALAAAFLRDERE
jgi:heat shock protein HslJ